MVLGLDLVIQSRLRRGQNVHPLPIPPLLHFQKVASGMPGRHGAQRPFDHLRSTRIDIHVFASECLLGTARNWQVFEPDGCVVSSTTYDSDPCVTHNEQV